MSSGPDIVSLRDRVDEHLEGIDDGTLMVLRGHLLMEEVLYDMLRAKSLNPKHLNKARLGYDRLLHIVRALYPPITRRKDQRGPTDDDIWTAIQALNGLRNQLAHRLEPKDVAPLLLKSMMLRSVTGPAPSLSDPEVVDALGRAIAVLLGFMTAHANKTLEQPNSVK